LAQTYGAERAEAIETVLRMIRMGNLLGNSGDYWLYRLSGGVLGAPGRAS
jgi:predicted chitinase